MTSLIRTAPREPFGRYELLALLLLALSSAALVAVAFSGNKALAHWLTSEEGPIEWLSPRAWFLLIPIILWRGPRNWTTIALAGTCLMFGLRELDLHKVIAHTSFLKNAFYRDPSITPADKWLGGVLAFVMLGTVLSGVVLGARSFWRHRLYRSSWGRILLGAAGLLVLSKVLDRLPNTLVVDYGIAMETHLKTIAVLHEEWLECYVPLVYLVAAWFRPA